MAGSFRQALLATSALMPLGVLPAPAGPAEPQVVGGSATVQGLGTANVTVSQSTDKAIINWKTFNIGAGETTRFVQPSASSVALNRVTGRLGPSEIYGTLSANGRVFLVNPDGILVGPGAKIDTAGYLATTHDIKNEDFMAGRYNFSVPGRPDASVVNQGAITAQDSGFAALVAPGVRNTGTITATLGKIGLASGNGFSLDFYGDKLITLSVEDSIAVMVKDVATGQSLNALVKNEGRLQANGGRVELSAAAARKVVDSVINNKGVIEANSIGTRKGMIVLGAATASKKPAGAPTQSVKVSGTLSSVGKSKNTKGGKIEVTGEAVELTGATLDASGRNGGGTVLIGGDVGGGNPNPAVAGIPAAKLEAAPVPTASTVTVDAGTIIDASATQSGDGGKVVVWSDQATAFSGAILARGGASSGDGGFVETSGHRQLAFSGTVDLGAPNGQHGTLLLDPENVTISAGSNSNGNLLNGTFTPSGDSSILNVTSLQNALASSNVLVTTGGAGSTGSQAGDITVADGVSWSSANSLTLSAYRNVTINANISNTGGAAVTLHADNSGTGLGTVSFASGRTVSTSGPVSIFFNPSANPAGSVVNATSYVNPTENYSGNVIGGATLTSYMLVNSVNDLQNIQNNLSGTYALGKDIDASITSSWNSGAGFVPIGNPFNGTFNGQAFAINGLTINSAATDVGLFGLVGSPGSIRNVGLTNVSVTGGDGISSHYTNVGGLVGQNLGSITQSNSTGNVASGMYSNAGGLAGLNLGSITYSSSASAVSGRVPSPSATNSSFIGGLVGNNNGNGIISDSNASGPVSGEGAVTTNPGVAGGGFAGYNQSTIINSHATGSLNGINRASMGGFVAINWGTITGSYASGAVIAGTNSTAGGFVSHNAPSGRITLSYATGAVTAGANSTGGGFIGANDPGGIVGDSWASGKVSGNGGGFIGLNNGTINNSYWDTDTTGKSTSQGLVINNGTFSTIGLTSIQARAQSSYAGWDFNSDWFMIDGQTRPFLRSEYSTTIANAHQLQLVSMNLGASYMLANNIDLGPALATDANGKYPGMWGSAGFAPIGTNSIPFVGVLNGSEHIIDHLGINSSARDVGLFGAIGSTGLVSNLGLTNIAIASGNNAVTGGMAASNFGTITNSYVTGSVTTAGFMSGLLVGANGDPNYQLKNLPPGTNNGTIAESYAAGTVSNNGGNAFIGGLAGINLFGSTIANSYAQVSVSASQASGEVGGLVGRDNGLVFTSYSTGAVSGGGVRGGLFGALFINYANPVVDSYWDTQTSGQSSNAGFTGGGPATAVGIGLTSAEARTQSSYVGFDFNNTWFMINGQTRPFLRSEYSTTISNAHQLQLVSMNLGASYTLARDIDLGPALAADANGNYPGMWGSAGFVPVGSGTAFTGTFDGRSHVIDGLAINSSGAQLGLLGLIGNTGAVSNLDLSNVSINGSGGNASMGAVAGTLSGTITNVNVTGSISGGMQTGVHAGGLVGVVQPSGAIDSATTAVAVATGNADSLANINFAGGLVGDNFGAITGSSSSGTIASGFGSFAGGLVGQNDGTITFSSSSSTVIGSSNSNGPPNAVASAIGGLVGENQGALISNSSATGAVSGSAFGTGGVLVGGLVGQFNGSGLIEDSYATGAVSAVGNAAIGGLVGNSGGALGNAVTIRQSFATGTVSGGSSGEAGGLVGLNRGAISQAYSTSRVSASGTTVVGGLIGTNSTPVDQTYAAGLVIGGNTQGGLIGRNRRAGLTGAVTNSYWDSQSTGQSTSDGGTSQTTAQLTSGLPAGFSSTVWTINIGRSYPYFGWQPASTIPTPSRPSSSPADTVALPNRQLADLTRTDPQVTGLTPPLLDTSNLQTTSPTTSAPSSTPPTTPPSAAPTPTTTATPSDAPLVPAGEIKGQLTLQVADGKEVTLKSYSNGDQESSLDAPHQSTDLIVHYAQLLGLVGISDIGEGKDAAKNLAALSGGKFDYVDGQTALQIELPKIGAVISIAGSSDNPGGHAGIVQSAKMMADGTFVVTLFDQNWPGSAWKTVTFTNESGIWKGKMTNSKAPGGFMDVAGWANPMSEPIAGPAASLAARVL